MISVLYVDDESDLLELCKQYLERTGEYAVDTAESAQEALEKVKTTPYDAIVSDYQMPGLDGIEFLTVLRREHPHLPFIIFTGKGREEVVIEAFEKGADFYLQKGGEPRAQFTELAHKIRQAVQLNRDRKALLESEEILRFIVKHDPNAIAVYDTGLHYIAVSDRYLKDYSVKEEEIIGKHPYEVFPEMPQKWRDVHQRCLAGAIENNDDDFFERPDGSITYNRWECRPWYRADGSIGGIVTYTEVTTGRKLAEEALRTSESFLNSIIEQSPHAMWISDARGTLLRLNRACREMLEITEEEVVGKYNVLEDNIVEEQGAMPLVRKVFESGEPVRFLLRYDSAALRQIPLSRTVRRVLDVTIFPIRDSSGKITNAVIQHIDVTAEHVAEQALRESEARFRALVENASDVIRIFDREGHIVFDTAASERLLGYPPGYTLGRSWVEFVHPDDTGVVRRELTEVYQNINTGTPTEFRIRKADGTYTWVESVGKNLVGVPGIDGIVITTRFIEERKKAEEALRESEDRYRTLAESADDLIFVINPAGIVEYVNTRGAQFLGKEQKDITGTPITSLFPVHIIDIFREKIRELMISGTPVSHEWSIEDRGDIRWFQTILTPFRGTGPSTLSLLGIAREITGLKESQNALQESEERYRSVSEHAAEGIVVAQDGTLQYANPQALQMIQATAEESANQPFTTFIHPDDRALVFERYQRRIRGEDVPQNYDFRVLGKKGRVTWVQISAVRITWNGRPATLNFLTDISRRKRAEEALRESEERYRILFQTMTQGVVYQDPAGIITGANPAAEEILGLSLDQMQGRTSLDPRWKAIREDGSPFPGDQHPAMEALRTGRPVQGVIMGVYHPRREEYRWILVDAIPMFGTAGASPSSVYTSFTDITGRKQAENALRQANRQLNLLSSITRHDILNKVTIILGYLDLATEKSTNTLMGDFIRKVELATKAIQTQIEFTRLYQDLGTHEPIWQEPGRIMPRAHVPESIALSVDLPGVHVYADPMLELVFFNLLDNSIRHGQQVTMIRVSCCQADEVLKITWEDNGIGIPVQEKERIFERGYGQNTGLGLYLVREILSITGMSIHETGTPGTGARFEITVPKGMYRVGETQPDTGGRE